jgi:3,4-dihydroxy 2-butanone 4-phosphate synthase/GTP cyclohydrolase II
LDDVTTSGAEQPPLPGFSSVEEAIRAIAAGQPVVVVDDDDRENEGDLIIAADAATPEQVAFFLAHTSGVICVALPGERLDALRIPLMVDDNTDRQTTAFTVTVDARRGTTTGISAADRSRTIQALGDSRSRPRDFTQPGHVFPLRARAGGVLRRTGHTEAAVDLARLAGRPPAGALCEIVSEDKRGMARLPELRRFAEAHGLPLIAVADLVGYRLRRERLVSPVAQARLPTEHGEFQCYVWEALADGSHHIALVRGQVRGEEPVLVRVHSECLTGDVFGSLRCDCGAQLDAALARIADEGRGVCVYLRQHEGRGIGLAHKLRAYDLQDHGRDTVDANLELGFPVDSREYGIGAQILADLGVRRMRLLTNNPAKYTGLQGFGLEISERIPLLSEPTEDNIAYLRTKHERMGHLLEGFH